MVRAPLRSRPTDKAISNIHPLLQAIDEKIYNPSARLTQIKTKTQNQLYNCQLPQEAGAVDRQA
ncbi:MAG: hypothetical protein F6J93_19835 [Oscillatoria sp. SIO1A7]|nr:hypothetical protein [Oscillatoria sp. SIO1A7]